jgi:hypothetical protein
MLNVILSASFIRDVYICRCHFTSFNLNKSFFYENTYTFHPWLNWLHELYKNVHLLSRSVDNQSWSATYLNLVLIFTLRLGTKFFIGLWNCPRVELCIWVLIKMDCWITPEFNFYFWFLDTYLSRRYCFHVFLGRRLKRVLIQSLVWLVLNDIWL